MKYWQLFLLIVSQFSSHRLKIFLSFWYNFITPIVIVTAISQAKSTGAVNTNGIISYYAFVLLFMPLLGSGVQDYISQLTFTGDINNFLTKPVSVYRWFLCRETGEKLISVLLYFPVGLLVIRLMGIEIANFGWIRFAELLISVIFSYFLSFNFAFLIGLFSFWIEEFWTINNLRAVLILLLGGVALPYTFFPKIFSETLYYLPFPYLVSWQSRIINGNASAGQFLWAGFWVVLTYLLVLLFWDRATNKYSLIGG